MRAFIVSAAMVAVLFAAPAGADLIEGEARVRGYFVSAQANFDGAGSCRMVIRFKRYNVIDFPPGELAEDCAGFGPQHAGSYVEMYVVDAPPIPCTARRCPKASPMSHFTATSFVR